MEVLPEGSLNAGTILEELLEDRQHNKHCRAMSLLQWNSVQMCHHMLSAHWANRRTSMQVLANVPLKTTASTHNATHIHCHHTENTLASGLQMVDGGSGWIGAPSHSNGSVLSGT